MDRNVRKEINGHSDLTKHVYYENHYFKDSGPRKLSNGDIRE